MSCQICYNSFDHSKHKPYFLSCPHTFCLECLDKLNENKCPTCKKPIESKYPNLALLELIPESAYDTVKSQLERNLIETCDLHKTATCSYEQLISENTNKIKSIKRLINTTANDLINLIKLNQTKLLNQVSEQEELFLKQIDKFKINKHIDDKITYSKVCLNKNNLNEFELNELNFDLNQIKLELTQMKNMSKLNQQFEFIKYKMVNSETGVFGEIMTNEAEFEELIKKGKEFYTAGKFRESIECYDKACEINSSNSLVHNFKAESFSAIKDFKKAIECCDRSIYLDKSNPVLYCNKGMVLFQLKEYSRAIEYFNKAIEMNSNYAIAYREKGIALRCLCKYDEAVECFDKVLQINPYDPVVINLKGGVLAEIKHFKQAFQCYSKCLQLDKSFVFNNTCYNQLNESFKLLNKAINSGFFKSDLKQ